MLKVLFIGKKDDTYAKLAVKFLKNKNMKVKVLWVKRNNKSKLNNILWHGDYIISYLCPILIPLKIINKAKIAAINFHPGPPEYPGIGCTNYAIYNNDNFYGVTCHFMSKNIDDGPIIDVKRFKIKNNETLFSLTEKSYKNMYHLYEKTIKKIFLGQELQPSSNIEWVGKAKTRKQFLKFLELSSAMSAKEIKKRIYSSTYPGFEPAHFKIKGIKFFGLIDE